MSSAINTTPAANASESGPSASTSTNPLQRPRSKSRTIIRMLTTKFSHPSTSTSSNTNDAHPTSTEPSSSAPTTHALHLKIPKPSKPKAPPKVAPTGFADPAARAAALRARGLLPPLPVLDLSEQERERDARLPVLESEAHSQEGMAQWRGEEGGDQGETAADRIKREWAARNGIEIGIPTPLVDRLGDDEVGGAKEVDEGAEEGKVGPQQVDADPQRTRMRAFKFGGGSTPTTPTVDAPPAMAGDGAVARPEVHPVTPVTPIGLDIDVSLIDFSEPALAPAPTPTPAVLAMETTKTTFPARQSSLAAAPTITAGDVAAGSTGSTATLITATPPATLSAEINAPASSSPHPAPEAENVRPISIEIAPPEAVAAPVTAGVPTARDSDNAGADKGGDVPPGSSAPEVHVPQKSESAVSRSLSVRALPALPPSATPVSEEEVVGVDAGAEDEEDGGSSLPDRPLAVSAPVAVVPRSASPVLVPAPEPAQSEEGRVEEALVTVDADTSSLPTPPSSTETPSRTALTPPTSPSFRAAFSQTPPASPPPVRNLPLIPGATVRLLPSLPAPTSSSPPPSNATTSTTSNVSKNLQPLLMAPSLSSDTQTSTASDDTIGSSTSGSTMESIPVITPVTPAFANSNNPFANPSDDNNSTPRASPLAKGKLGSLSVKTQGGLGVLPVLVHSPVTESMQGVALEVVHEESHDGAWLDSQATTPAAVLVEKNPADELLESMGLDKGAFARGLAQDDSLALGLGLDTTSPGTEQVVPAPPTPVTPLSPNRVPAVTISTPSTGAGATPRNKKRGMTDPGSGAPERRKSLFGGFRKGDGAAANNEGSDGTPQRRVSVVASLGNLRRSVVGTISGSGGEKKERDKKAASRSRSPRRFDASHLPPSPSPFAGFSAANAAATHNMSVSVNVNDAYRNDGMPGSPRTTSSHGSGSVLSHQSRTVLAPGSSPQLRRTAVPSSPVQRRTAVEPVMYSRGSILLETANIEDEETRRMTEMAFLG
ncbi:hypothetical protein D9619_004148 [Psilocybe cf. subviscida]|uniref:Uncharacterized protein n=1 Tax=Psilocybe cf. subviscida TaxID=2480587 RepID=A0A8H5F7Z8_9AGAR|nr:hypothetical protein D9619_004148 [Psilocybe cf. subviscida]